MNHKGTQTLETSRLILRQFRLSDADAMFRNWASDDEVTKFLTWPAHADVSVSKEYIDSLIEDYKDPSLYNWAIELKGIGEPVGAISVVRCDPEVGSMHIGYCIGRNWWHRGITSEALAAVIRFLMEDVGVNRIDSRHDPRNPNSGKVMMKCGLRFEGTLRQSDVSNQGICDASWYGLLREEYFLR